MLTNKKELEKINESITNLSSIKEELKKDFSELTNLQFNNQKNSLDEINKRLNDLEERNHFLSQNFEQEISKTTELNSLLKKRVDSFKLFEEMARKKIMEDVKFEISKNLQSMFETTKKYKELENYLLVLNKKIDNLSSEINKFQQISSQIKTADFELEKYVKSVSKEDAEKLRLMRENEKLKMLIAKQRRRSY